MLFSFFKNRSPNNESTQSKPIDQTATFYSSASQFLINLPWLAQIHSLAAGEEFDHSSIDLIHPPAALEQTHNARLARSAYGDQH